LLDQLESSSIDLVITSPPFALQREKSYGNVDQAEYVNWLFAFCEKVHRVLTPRGSFILDLGGAYQKGRPVRSLYNYRVLIRLCDELDFRLAEEFFWYNPAKLPSPIEWVNKRKLRAKDSVNTVWWLSKEDNPKADITRVLVPYSDRMKKLQSNPDSYYKPKLRPSGHDIGKSFATDNGGAIPSNLLQIPNTESNSRYIQLCKSAGVAAHPARFPQKLPAFFIEFLTEPNDIVLDIFAGSNTTGLAAKNSAAVGLRLNKNEPIWQPQHSDL
jgi:site-specific DNA-methyltransferase (cytosine-N4-specific)